MSVFESNTTTVYNATHFYSLLLTFTHFKVLYAAKLAVSMLMLAVR